MEATVIIDSDRFKHRFLPDSRALGLHRVPGLGLGGEEQQQTASLGRWPAHPRARTPVQAGAGQRRERASCLSRDWLAGVSVPIPWTPRTTAGLTLVSNSVGLGLDPASSRSQGASLLPHLRTKETRRLPGWTHLDDRRGRKQLHMEGPAQQAQTHRVRTGRPWSRSALPL